MATASMRVEGADELARQLARLPRKVADATRSAISDAADDIQSEAQNNVPVDSGDLQASITAEVAIDGLSADVVVGEHYGTFLEHGTSSIPAQPFMLPAAEAERARLPDRLRDAAQGVL